MPEINSNATSVTAADTAKVIEKRGPDQEVLPGGANRPSNDSMIIPTIKDPAIKDPLVNTEPLQQPTLIEIDPNYDTAPYERDDMLPVAPVPTAISTLDSHKLEEERLKKRYELLMDMIDKEGVGAHGP